MYRNCSRSDKLSTFLSPRLAVLRAETRLEKGCFWCMEGKQQANYFALFSY